MRVLEGLKPERFFYYFEEISKIPHGSYNTDAISDYCLKVGQSLGLECWKDEFNNVTIIKEAATGYEQAPALIIQGHLDMVNEKTPDSDHDFEKDPLKLRIEGDWIHATGTTLGADDGVAVAYVLALLEDKTIAHPRLECILTSDEEAGMDGAFGYDASRLTGKRMLNLDSDSEGIFLTSCAGGIRYQLLLPLRRIESAGSVVKLSLTGLMGGHSGVEIDKYRGNSNILMGYVLNRLSESIMFGLISVEGGLKDNAIPRDAFATLMIDSEEFEALKGRVAELEAELQKDFAGIEENICLSVSEPKEQEVAFIHPDDQKKALFLLMQVPNGVQAMSMNIPGLVETSLNLGVVETTNEQLSLAFALRSSVESRKHALGAKLANLITFLGGTYETVGDYPGWAYCPNSELREMMAEVYRDMYGKEPVIQAVHAGLECGLFSEKIPGLDIISTGPTALDIHTPDERMNISSAARFWEYLLELLRRMK